MGLTSSICVQSESGRLSDPILLGQRQIAHPTIPVASLTPVGFNLVGSGVLATMDQS